jgi:hypothetical protein
MRAVCESDYGVQEQYDVREMDHLLNGRPESAGGSGTDRMDILQ